MARIVIRCQYTGHYVFTGFDTQTSPAVAGGRIFCPYCVAEHVWSSTEARLDDRERERRQKPRSARRVEDRPAPTCKFRCRKFCRNPVRNASQFPWHR